MVATVTTKEQLTGIRSARRRHYQAQDARMTLADGLAEYYAANAGRVTPPGALPLESQALFRSHDICHVIFGLDTTLEDEAMADTRTLLSSDVGWGRYSRYLSSDAQTKAIFKEVGYLTVLRGTLRAVPRMLRAVGEAWRMHGRWPWEPPEAFMDRTLADLRREFRIRVV
ncbi:MAG: hypothetical protein ABI376_08350 [Caulobacteraceae bacterium]